MSNDPKGKAATVKLKFENIPLTALVDLANGMNDGAAKYGSHNWLTVDEPLDNMVYINAALRHIVLYMAGEDTARDSNINHLAHVICGLSVLRSAEAVGKVQDNRRKLPGEAINRLAEDVCGPAYVASNQLDRACADNPELPREFVKELLSRDTSKAVPFNFTDPVTCGLSLGTSIQYADNENTKTPRVFKTDALLNRESFTDSGLGGPESTSTRLSDTQFNINAHYGDRINYGGTD